jgi:hypothetical protein
MTRTRTLKADSPADLLAVVPYILGFHPEDSVVLLTVGDATHSLHARVDLPQEPEEIDLVVDNLTEAAGRNGLRQAALVLYCDDECLAEAVCAPLRERLHEVGVDVLGAVRADGSRWYPMNGCTDACCCEGTPYDVGSHRFTAQSVLEGQVTWRSRRELADSLVARDLDEVESVERAAGEAVERFKRVTRGTSAAGGTRPVRTYLVGEGRWLAERVRRFLADQVPLQTEEVGRLLVAMAPKEVRDVAWAEMTHANARLHVELWRDVTRRSPSDLVAAPAALLGFAAWLSGDGALAWCAVDRCQEAEPDYALAGLLTQALAGAVPPSSWEPFDPARLTLFAR